MRTGLSLIVLAIILLGLPFPACAHAVLLSATPGEREVLRGPDISVKLRFNSRIDAKRSRVILVASDGSQTTLALGDQPSPDTLASQAKGLRMGAFILRWQVLASDGHITRGEIPFRVE
jgi:methionine-rich copper-binding protein CopC